MAEKFANVTISGRIGPGFTVTSLLLSNVVAITFGIKNNTIDVEMEQQKHRIFDYQSTATITYTISGQTATITIS